MHGVFTWKAEKAAPSIKKSKTLLQIGALLVQVLRPPPKRT
jgi:hypothetical protein